METIEGVNYGPLVNVKGMLPCQLLSCCYFIEMLFIHYQWFKLNFVQVLYARVYKAFRASREMW